MEHAELYVFDSVGMGTLVDTFYPECGRQEFTESEIRKLAKYHIQGRSKSLTWMASDGCEYVFGMMQDGSVECLQTKL